MRAKREQRSAAVARGELEHNWNKDGTEKGEGKEPELLEIVRPGETSGAVSRRIRAVRAGSRK